jgi:hypothetical protein
MSFFQPGDIDKSVKAEFSIVQPAMVTGLFVILLLKWFEFAS